ncbi:MAG TPA: TIM barrel protein [Firmicutes bacterium]|nr:TIM barrel protein [Bacillota bacterium]
MNRVGIYYAFWEREWSADFLPYVKKVKKLGFDTLEVAAGALPEMTAAARRALREEAEAEGIQLTCCMGLDPAHDVSSPDESVRREGVKYVGTVLDCIHEIGSHVFSGINYAYWPIRIAADYDYKMAARERSLVSLREILKKAEDYGIAYCLEVVNRFEQCILNCAAEGVAYLRELESPAAKLLLDTFHMNIEEDSLGDAIRSAKGVLGHFHIGECNRKTPGTGRMPWREIFSALRDIDYTGAVVMEPFIRMGGQVGKDIKIFRDIGGGADDAEMDRLAAEAAAFVRRGLEG